VLRGADKAGTRVLAYLSIGELGNKDENLFRRFLNTYHVAPTRDQAPFRSLEGITLSYNEKFQSRHIDVLAELWQAFILAEVDRLYALGVHGLLLDTVDTVDLYLGKKDWPLERRWQSATAMLGLVRAIKARDRGKFVLQNRGLNLIGATAFVGDDMGKEMPGLDLLRGHPDNPDGILWENAFASQDAWSLGREKLLRDIQQSGQATVIALGYQATIKQPDTFFRRSAAAGFVAAWATASQDLHQELTSGPPAISAER
jgi:endo-alpha-1,4-polygalactosaminidase (GH114 family)